jgi:hypothetical protein
MYGTTYINLTIIKNGNNVNKNHYKPNIYHMIKSLIIYQEFHKIKILIIKVLMLKKHPKYLKNHLNYLISFINLIQNHLYLKIIIHKLLNKYIQG